MKNNFKRCLALLLAIMTIVGSFAIPVSAADGCTHNWEMKDKKEPTCATQGYESWFCTLCQKYEVRNITSRLDHEYVFVVEAKEPTCSVDGHPKEAYVCKNGCGMYYVERPMSDAEKDQYKKQPAISTDPNYDLSKEVYHKWGAPTVDGEACTKKEYDITYTCEYCDGEYVKSATGSGAHTFGALKITKAPTCVAVGSASRTCSTCKYVEQVEISKVTTHTYTKTEANLQYESREVYYKNNSNEDDKTLIKRAQHRSFYVCDVAGCSAREYVEGTKDNYVDCDNGNDIANNDGWVLKGAASTCSYRATFERTCKKCGLTQTRKDWNQPFHKSSDTVIDEQEKVHTNVEVKDGYKVYLCVNCNVQFKLYDGYKSSDIVPNVEKVDDNYAGAKERYVPSNLNDHKWKDESVQVKPTCTQTGLKSQYCTEPGCVAKRNVSVAAAHDYTGAAKQLVYPTCTTDGYVYQACIRCNYQNKLKTFAKFGSHSSTTYDAYTNIDKILKNLKSKYEGLKIHTDSNSKALYVAPTEASIKAAQVDMGYTASTCFNEGVTFKVCSVCNTKVGNDTTKAKLNHKSEWIDSSVYGVYYGTGCYDDRYYTIECPNNACKTSTKVVVIAKNDAHDFSGEQVVFEEPTCYSKGVAGRVCQREDCGAKVEEVVLDFAINYHPHADKQIPSDQVTTTVNLPANGGSWNQPSINDFSCAEVKYQWMYCEDCHRNYRVEYAVSITDSMFLAAIGSSTATQFYYNGKVYNVADYNSGDIVATTGKHTKIYLLSTVPSCDRYGKGTEVCLMCGVSVKDATVPMLAHTVGDTKYVAGTYDVAGAQTCAGAINWSKRCEVCFKEVEFGTYNALPHSFIIRDPADPNNLDKMSLVKWVDCVEEVNGVDVTLSATCAKEGKQQRKCVNCDYLEYRVSSKLSKHSTSVVYQDAVAATCTTTGFTKTYKCDVEGCGVLFYIKDNKHVVVTAAPVVAATGHSVYSKFTKDGIHGNSGDDSAKNPVIIGEQIVVPGCGGYTANVVYCNKAGCLGYNSDPTVTGDKYVVGYTNYVVGRTHKVDETADRIKVEATCSTWEYTYLPCVYNCGAQLDKVDNKDVPKKMHLNKNGDILTGNCQLVLCAECDAAGRLSCADCEDLYVCVNVLTWKDEAKTQPGEICKEVLLPTHNYTKTTYASCNVVKSTCSECGDVAWNNEEGGSVKVYHKYAVKSEPTIYAAGVEACTVCGYENPVELPKIAALVFDIEAYNPLDPTGSIVNGGKVYVKISMKALEAIEVNSIRIALAYDTESLVFVGAVDNKSVFGEFAQANAEAGIAYIFDDAGKERYNVTLEGEMEYTTLEFYVLPGAFKESNRLDSIISFVIPTEDDDWSASVEYYDVAASTDKKDVYSQYAFDVTTNNRVNLKIDQLGDYTNNGKIDASDLSAVRDRMIDMINGVEGVEYDAVLDIDHDGDIDMDDYGYIKEYMVKKYTVWQFGDIISYNAWFAEIAADEENTLKPSQYHDAYYAWLGYPELV